MEKWQKELKCKIICYIIKWLWNIVLIMYKANKKKNSQMKKNVVGNRKISSSEDRESNEDNAKVLILCGTGIKYCKDNHLFVCSNMPHILYLIFFSI